MTRRERLMATLNGKAVDRPAFNFYEISGTESMSADDQFNIYSHPSWKPLIEMARDKTDRIVMCTLPFESKWNSMPEVEGLSKEYIDENGSKITITEIKTPSKTLVQKTRRDKDLNTIWTTEHLIKDEEDFKAWLELPEPIIKGFVNTSKITETEKALGETGILMIDSPDPLCGVAPLFEMGTYTIIALTEQDLFHKALQKKARELYPKIEAVAKALPGRLWRICGPEYASPPYLPPQLFHDYVTEYVKPMVDLIQKNGGIARIHSHGKLKAILDEICLTEASALDPIEPPPQGDVELSYVRKKYGHQLVLFGNLEITDIENLNTVEFERKIIQALKEGTEGNGRGFVLMPSSCPYGRELPSLTVKNYEKIVEMIEKF